MQAASSEMHRGPGEARSAVVGGQAFVVLPAHERAHEALAAVAHEQGALIDARGLEGRVEGLGEHGRVHLLFSANKEGSLVAGDARVRHKVKAHLRAGKLAQLHVWVLQGDDARLHAYRPVHGHVLARSHADRKRVALRWVAFGLLISHQAKRLVDLAPVLVDVLSDFACEARLAGEVVALAESAVLRAHDRLHPLDRLGQVHVVAHAEAALAHAVGHGTGLRDGRQFSTHSHLGVFEAVRRAVVPLQQFPGAVVPPLEGFLLLQRLNLLLVGLFGVGDVTQGLLSRRVPRSLGRVPATKKKR